MTYHHPTHALDMRFQRQHLLPKHYLFISVCCQFLMEELQIYEFHWIWMAIGNYITWPKTFKQSNLFPKADGFETLCNQITHILTKAYNQSSSTLQQHVYISLQTAIEYETANTACAQLHRAICRQI